MNDELLSRLADAVLARLDDSLPRAFCVGKVPPNSGFQPVSQPPYDMVVLCSLSPRELLSMPSEEVCRALLEGKPVYLMEEGLEYRHYPRDRARSLHTLFLAKERELRNFGVKPWSGGTGKKLLTVQDVRDLAPGAIPKNAVLTPLARDYLEGKV